MATFIPYLKPNKRKRQKPTGEPIYIRITHNRESLFHPTGLHIPPEDWDFKRHQAKPNAKHGRELNQALLREIHRAREAEINLLNRNYRITAQLLKHELSFKATEGFTDYMERLIEDIARDNSKLATRYRAALRFISQVKDKVSFDDLNVQFIKAIDRYLKEVPGQSGKGLSINYRGKIMDVIKATINKAILEGATDITNPFARFKIKREFVESEYLSFEDFSLIESVKLVGKLAVARDFFLLAAYLSGMRANELLRAKKEDIEVKEGITVLRQNVSKREAGKRRVKYSIIIPKALAIIEKYPGKFLLPYMEKDRSIPGALVKINEALKEVARLAGVKPFSTKYARKTLINRLSSLKYPSSQIANLVGHSSSQTTEKSYISVDLSFQSQALEEAFK